MIVKIASAAIWNRSGLPDRQPKTAASLRHVGGSDRAIRRQRGSATGWIRRALAAPFRHHNMRIHLFFRAIPPAPRCPGGCRPRPQASPLVGGENFTHFSHAFFLTRMFWQLELARYPQMGDLVPPSRFWLPHPVSHLTAQQAQHSLQSQPHSFSHSSCSSQCSRSQANW
jgi:hypothetical protein